MPQIEIPSYRRIDSTQQNNQNAHKQARLRKGDYISGAISFLLSRTSMLGQMSPFACAFFSASYSRIKMPLTMLCSLIGMLSAGMGTEAFKYLIAMSIFTSYKFIFDKNNTHSAKTDALITSASLFVGGMFVMFFDMVLTYSIALLVLECIICGFVTIIFKESTEFLNRRETNIGYITNEQLLSVLMIFGLCVSAISDITTMGPINISHIICSVSVILLAYCRGISVGACAGACAGIFCALKSTDILPVIGIYTLCGFFAGCARPLGKIGSAIAFAACATSLGFLTTMYIYGNVGILNFIIAAVIVMLYPGKKLERASSYINGYCTSRSDIPYIQRMQTLIHHRIGDLYDSFDALAGAFDELSQKRDTKDENQLASVFDDASRKVCTHCGLRTHCWDKESKLTLDTISIIKKKLLEKGYADVLDVPQDFREKCVHCKEFLSITNHFFEINRINNLWESQLNESRKVLSEQYRGFASVMNNLRGEITNNIICETKYEKKISAELSKNKISLKSICVFECGDEGFEIEIEFYDEDDLCKLQNIEDIISTILGQPMRATQTLSNELRVIFEPLLNYKVESGVATLKKDGQNQNGDSYSTINLSDNRYAIAISDGMGSGENAACESSVTINLLKKLLIAGFDKTATIQLINSALVLKNGAEAFATIDLAIVDLATARAEFVKIGAATGYIRRADSIDTIYCNTLPAGILTEADIKLSSKRLQGGDHIVMVSDGVANASKNPNWICDTLLDIDENEEASTIAEIVLKQAVIQKHGKVDDDMTVIVTKILEK